MTEHTNLKDKCCFDLAWIGKCGQETLDGKELCPRHEKEKCAACGAQATHQCDETMGLVCGAPLCRDCEHEIDRRGTNGGVVKHCRKDAQKYKPWHAHQNLPAVEYELRALLHPPGTVAVVEASGLEAWICRRLEEAPKDVIQVSIKKMVSPWAEQLSKYAKSIDGEE
jgi:hypothetical protein